jgi:hypothetical protein
MVEPLTKSEMRKYLSNKRTYTKKRQVAILVVNVLFSILDITLLILNNYIIVAIVLALAFSALLSYSIVKLIKWIKFSDSYHSASIVVAYLYIVFSAFFYLLVYDVVGLYFYLGAAFVATIITMYLSYRHIKRKFENQRFPNFSKSGSMAVLLSGTVTLLSVTLFRDSFFLMLGVRIFVVAACIISGSYMYSDDYFNYSISKKLDARFY